MGGALRNVYRSQTLVPGLVTVGDAVATTTPTRGRGVAMACMQIAALLRLLDDGADPITVAGAFDAWRAENIKPWVTDHIAIDGGMERRWQGEDINLAAPLTSDLIADAVYAEPRIAPYAGDYFMMTGLPATLQPAEPLARAVYERRVATAHLPKDRVATAGRPRRRGYRRCRRSPASCWSRPKAVPGRPWAVP